MDCLTPPIVSDLEPSCYFIPSPETCHFPIPSDSSSSLNAELKDVEEVFFGQVNDDSILSSSPLPSALLPVSSPPLHEFLLPRPDSVRPDDLKLELPLLCNEPANDAALVDPLEMGQVIKSVPQSDVDDTSKATETIESAIKIELESAETRVMRSIEQEQLDPEDARARVPVPVMDFSIPEPEWTRLRSDANALFNYIREVNASAFNIPKWPTNRRAEDKMRWLPLATGAGRISTDEKPDIDDGILERFLVCPSDSEMITRRDCVWRRPGITTLLDNESDDEEDVQPILAEVEPESELMAAVRERKNLMTQGAGSQATVLRLQASQEGFTQMSRKRFPGDFDNEPPILAGDDSAAATTLLENFMNLHARKKPKFIRSPFFTKVEEEATKPTDHARLPRIAEETPAGPLTAPPSAQIPSVKAPSAPVKVMTSMHLQPETARGLEHLMPSVSVVQRDYSAHNTSVWHPGSVCRSEVIPALAIEADITVSPVTGLLITTMIKVRQRPIPGADGRSMLRVQIEKVSLRYERLIILVSEGNSNDTMADMSPSAVTAFVELQGFIDSLDTSTSMYYVAGGDKALMSWVASLICRYSHEALGVQHFLYPDETYWELFLRQAGMNVYAAQVISGILKPPDDSLEAARSGKYGLPGFIKMSAEDRVARFAPVLGGRRVLDRVSQVIDGSWD